MNENKSAELEYSKMAMGIASAPENDTAPDKPIIIMKRIGGTTYQVSVHFSKTNQESINDKIIRLIQNETEARG